MKTVKSKILAAGGVLALLLFVACNKESSMNSGANIPAGQSKMSIYMSDGPIDFYKVLVDIRQVAVLIDTSTQQNDSDFVNQWDDNYCGFHRGPQDKSVIWDTLSITPGTYNLMDLRNGADTLLAAGTYPSGKVLKVRITLGSDNSIYTDSLTSYPLVIFGPEPFFDINVRRENVFSISNDDFKLWLDFNLERSIFFWSGTFYLKPYVVAFNDMHLSKIEGFVFSPGSGALVEAIDGSDTLYAIPNWWTGGYMFRGVTAGTYSIDILGRNGYSDTTLSSIVVDSSSVTKVPTVTLHK